MQVVRMNAYYRLKSTSTLLAVAAVSAVNVTGGADRQACTRGNRAAVLKDFETAMTEYNAALDQDPRSDESRLKHHQAQLEPKNRGPFDTIRMTQDSRMEFEALANLAGLNVIFDPDFRGTRVQLELNNVDIYEGLDILALQTRSFWKPVNKTTILVSPDNQTKRRDYEELVLKTIYLTNSVTATELTEAITTLRTLLNMRYLMSSTAMNAYIIR